MALLEVRDRGTAPTRNRCRCACNTDLASARTQRCLQPPAVSEVGNTDYCSQT